tara:strand:+ start:9025 stop:9972 length:948 start_codon:yes stop_codon:yes gene_type:complete
MGISNSSKMILSNIPINLKNWKKNLNNGSISDRDFFYKYIKGQKLENKIFVDNTDSEIISKEYLKLLKNGIGVVTCNKIACSDNLKNYKSLKKYSKINNTPFLYETNIGAGLPIISTIKNLIASGDKIFKIEGILSGSLNYIFYNFKKGMFFYDVVKEAEKKGYTEPDPKIDLMGIDVARKILILARESGLNLELDDVINNSFLPIECISSKSKDGFYSSLKNKSSHFEEILNKAMLKNCKLKYVARLEANKASIGLDEITSSHNFYNLKGSDNIVLFYTARHKAKPLIIKGVGAGPEVTAEGILADILSIVRNK